MIRKDKAEGGDLYKYCRHKFKHRAKPVGGKRIPIPNRIPLSERPKEANGKRFGDFEMDTIVGKGNHGMIVTLIERNTNMLFMRKLSKGKNAKELARTVMHMMRPFRQHIKSITTDNGIEFACHEMITKSLGVSVYFTDPYSSCQKGGIENANGLIRQYISKQQTFENISHQQITKIANEINSRPRKKLDFRTPQECFYEKTFVNLHLLVESATCFRGALKSNFLFCVNIYALLFVIVSICVSHFLHCLQEVMISLFL